MLNMFIEYVQCLQEHVNIDKFIHITRVVLYCIGVGGRISSDVQSLNIIVRALHIIQQSCDTLMTKL